MRHGTATALAVGIVGAAAAAGCRSGVNYTGPLGPRYAGVVALAPPAGDAVHAGWTGATPDTIRVVTFNIQYARRIDSAIALLQSAVPLTHPDIVTLQEMDAAGTSRIAEALGMSWVYYPATVSPATGRDFGNAILSRWPIANDAKIILPHPARFDKTERIATAATILMGDVPVRVYSVHLGTIADVGPGARRDQARVVMADAAAYPRVIVSGDMNSHGIGKAFRAAGYAWPTERNPHTNHFWNWDHIFLRGLALRDSASTGVVRHNRHASDHRPVWAVVSLLARSAKPR
jgi:endonuclease/exonuclease/phosphatase family metal-dependent hydrolase